ASAELGGFVLLFCFSSRRRHTRFSRDWSSDVCSSDLNVRRLHHQLGMGPLDQSVRPGALGRRNGTRDGEQFPVLFQGERRGDERDRKSTRLNSSHVKISYAVFCLKKKKRDWGFSNVGK